MMVFIRSRVLIVIIVADTECPVRFHDDGDTIPLACVVYCWKDRDSV